MAFTIKLQDQAGVDLIDVSNFVKLGNGEGFDPTPNFEEGSFLDAPYAEGKPLVTVTENNAEIVVPMWVDAADKDSLTTLIMQTNKACQKVKRVYQKDTGSTYPSYRDVTWAKFEPAYSYWPAAKAWLAGTLRIYCAPPYAHTGTGRLISSGVASAVVGAPVAYATLPAGSLIGDVDTLIQAKVVTGASGGNQFPRADGRVVGWAAIPTGYSSFIPAASMYGINAAASLIGMAGFPGSQAIGPRSSVGGATSPLLARFALSASPYAGANRVFAYVRPGRPMPLAVVCTDENGAPIGPTALSRGVHGVHLVDLGVARVPTAAATVPFTVQWALPPVGQDDSAMNLRSTNDKHSGMLGGLLVFPEEELHVHVDPVQPVGGRWFIGTSVASVNLLQVPDDFGNSYSFLAGGSLILSPTLGMRSSVNASWPFGALLTLPESYENVRHRAILNGPSLPQVGQVVSILSGKGQISYDSLLQAQFTPTGPSGPMLLLSHYPDGTSGGISAGATLVLENTQWIRGASYGYIVDLVKQGDTAYANIRQFNTDNTQMLSGSGSVTEPVGSVGFTDVTLRAWRAQVGYLYSDGPGNGNIFGHFIDVLTQRPVPSDAYIFDSGAVDGMSYRQSGNTGSAPLLMEPYMRGGPQMIDPDTARIAAFAAGLDSVRATNPVTVEVRVRERFRFVR